MQRELLEFLTDRLSAKRSVIGPRKRPLKFFGRHRLTPVSRTNGVSMRMELGWYPCCSAVK